MQTLAPPILHMAVRWCQCRFSLSFNADSSCNFGFLPGDSSFNSGGLYFRANRQQRFHKSVPPGNYSGITYLGSNRYALVSDKAEEDGFYVFRIDVDSLSGKILNVVNEGYRSAGLPNRDMEAIAWFPVAGTLFISGEKHNEIYELSLINI